MLDIDIRPFVIFIQIRERNIFPDVSFGVKKYLFIIRLPLLCKNQINQYRLQPQGGWLQVPILHEISFLNKCLTLYVDLQVQNEQCLIIREIHHNSQTMIWKPKCWIWYLLLKMFSSPALGKIDLIDIGLVTFILWLIHWGQYQMAANFLRTISNAFLMKIYEFPLRFHRSLFPRVQLTIFHHWLRLWLGAGQATSHYLNQWWLVYWHIYPSLGLNDLTMSFTVKLWLATPFPTRPWENHLPYHIIQYKVQFHISVQDHAHELFCVIFLLIVRTYLLNMIQLQL